MEDRRKAVGDFLKEKFLEPFDISPSSLAKDLHVSRTRINDILKGKRAITADTDLRLSKFFGLEPGYFLKLQAEDEILKAKERLKEVLLKIEPRKDGFTNKEIIFDRQPKKLLKIALLCGGPSLERGISLNSARSVLDHLSREEVELEPIYVDIFKNFYSLSKSQLYSNTPSDFDFKLHKTAKILSEKELILKLKSIDIVFPVMHGNFGEDGGLQAFLEKNRLPFIGSDSRTCQKMFDKHSAFYVLKRNGFPTIFTEMLKRNDPDLEKKITDFFRKSMLGRVVIKPVAGGSSIGVFSAYTPKEAVEKTKKLFDIIGEDVLIEPFCYGKEFTVIVLQNPDGSPVALVPTEIEVNYENGGVFDYRRKYLPTSSTRWFCPPRFDDAIVEEIRKQAEELFKIFGMRDFARLDGWFLNDGRIIFTDFNPISGMEQNSFIFQQASRIGFSHGDLLWNIVCSACKRENIQICESHSAREEKKEPVHIIFGGKTAERQVSLMTGTNVWLKLKKSKKIHPEPFLLDRDNFVWHLPYTYSLNHTVEEIYENCLTVDATVERLERFLVDIKKRLVFASKSYDVRQNLPRRYSFEDFLEFSKAQGAFVFIALHGGEGENGVIQEKLEKYGLSYNGSRPKASYLCMDKYLTGQAIANMGDSQILTVPKKQVKISSFSSFKLEDYDNFWLSLKIELGSETFIIKPQRDGCSAGIIRLFSCQDLKKYVEIMKKGGSVISPYTFKNQTLPVELSINTDDDYLIESFIETDYIRILKNELIYKPKNGWLEMTVGVVEKSGNYHAFNPSITIAEGEVLSVEEKFQGGTGVNITPPMDSIIPEQGLFLIKSYSEKIARALNIQNYCRLDLFFNVNTSLFYLIEANTLPALTPATVLYHQALAEKEPIHPQEFLEMLIETKKMVPDFKVGN